jgi:hypothetical protein
MDRPLVAVALAAAVFGASTAAQSQERPAAPPSLERGPVPDVSEADLRKFAIITVQLEEAANRFEQEMLRAKTEEEAREIQARMQKQTVATVVQYGWTPEQYVLVTQAISADPGLADRARALIDREP